jgi:hypothetical protein
MTRPRTEPNEPMTLLRFGELVEAYGAELARWPDVERRRAEQLLEREPAAALQLAEAARLDDLLDAYEAAPVTPALRARVLEAPVRAARSQRRFGFGLAWAAAFSCLIGIASGAYSADEASSTDDEWTELAALTLAPDLDPDSDAIYELGAEDVP